jgi:hypothetical protein
VEEERAEEEHGPDDAGMEEERGADIVEVERGTDVEEERGAGVNVHVKDAEEGGRGGGCTVEGGCGGGAGTDGCGE